MKWNAHGLRILAVMTIAVCITASRVFALDPQKAITQFKHQHWAGESGIDSVSAIAQTEDGYIWINTGTGLLRFDGVAFTRWTPNPGDPDLPGQ